MQLKLQVYATAICLLGLIIGMLVKMMAPEYWTDLYPAVLAFFWLLEMILSFIVGRYGDDVNAPTLRGKEFMRIYMIAKILKATLTIVAVLIGINYVDDTHTVVFAGSTIAFYLFNLGMEARVLSGKKK